jgi:alanyl-tRNA synthetase
VGDNGVIESHGAIFEVADTQKQGGNLFLHKGTVVQGVINNGKTCTVRVNAEDRLATELNHSATHLMHAALRQILGDHVTQKGSLVNPQR